LRDRGIPESQAESALQPGAEPAVGAGQAHLVGFVDTGTVTLNKNPWFAGQNSRTLSGAGIGLTWTDYGNLVVRAYYAHKLGSAVATSAPDKNGRFWIQAVKYF